MGHTIYLAGPMTGYPDDNYPLFNETAARLRAWGWDVLNPAETFGGDRSRRLSDYMRADTEMLCNADGLALLDGWEQSEGARFEVLMAQKRGMPIYDARSMALINGSIPTVYTTFTPDEARALNTADDEIDSIGFAGPEPAPTVKELAFQLDQATSARTTQRVMAALKHEPETILQEAQRLVYGDRQASYGHPADDYTRTGKLWGAILGTDPIDPRLCALMMAAVKISREVNAHKRDNLTDLAGYAACADRIARRQAGEE